MPTAALIPLRTARILPIMEPDIRYATTSDGVSIAYWTMGEGEAYLELQSPPFNNIEGEWQWEYHRLVARDRRLIRYDARGSGLSQRSIADFSLDAVVLDLEAVVDALALDRFNLWGEVAATPAAITYAARHPDRVAHLALYAPLARPADFYALPRMKAIQSLLDHDDWEAYTDAMALSLFSWDQASAARDMAAFYRGCTDLADAKRCIEAQLSFDVTDILPNVAVPTVVMYPRGGTFPTLAMARQFASRIPGARIAILESDGYWTDQSTDGVLRLLAEFFGDASSPAASSAASAPPGAFRTVLFTDIVGNTEMMQRLGDTLGRDLLREHERITRETLARHGGAEVKTDGDSFMVSFTSATSAVDCAIALQRSFAAYSASAKEPVVVRMGLNAGEPIEEAGDYFGSSINLAARVCAQADGGEILIPEPVRHLLSGKTYVYADRGERLLKGFEDAVRLFEVRWHE